MTGPTPPNPASPPGLPDWWATTASALDTKMGFEVSELTAARVVGSMPVEGNTQPYGLWHGGASCVLAETLASIGSFAHAQTVAPGSAAVGVDLNATHHRPARSGRVTGVATALHLGRRTTSYEVVLSDDEGRRVCTARVTCQVVRGEPRDAAGGGMGRPAPRSSDAGPAPAPGASPTSGADPDRSA